VSGNRARFNAQNLRKPKIFASSENLRKPEILRDENLRLLEIFSPRHVGKYSRFIRQNVAHGRHLTWNVAQSLLNVLSDLMGINSGYVLMKYLQTYLVRERTEDAGFHHSP
jgi:hypothetical protein